MNDLAAREALATLHPPPGAPAAAWAARITACWRASVEGILEVGRLITAAKLVLPEGQFESMIEAELPFTARTAQRLMAIAADERLGDPTHVSLLPPAWGTLYELTKLTDEQFAEAVSDGKIRPDVERTEIVALRKAIRNEPGQQAYRDRVNAGCTLADLHALADSGAQFASFLADPNWRYETWSDKGKDRSPEQHYDTDAVDAIKQLPVKRLAAKNSILHLWCMDWLLPPAIEVIEGWGFKLINVGFVWVKENPNGGDFMGLGHWTRNSAELCLLATKGHPIRRSAAVRQVIRAPIGRHSEKPKEIYERVQALSGGPYLELYARELREGWTCWGDEIPRIAFAEKLRSASRGEEKPDHLETPSLNLLPKSESIPEEHRAFVDDDLLDIPSFLDRRESKSVVVASPRDPQLESAGRDNG